VGKDLGVTKDLTEVVVSADTYHVSPEPMLLIADLDGALALCLHDEGRGVGGLLHLKFMGGTGRPSDVTDIPPSATTSRHASWPMRCPRPASMSRARRWWISSKPISPTAKFPAERRPCGASNRCAYVSNRSRAASGFAARMTCAPAAPAANLAAPPPDVAAPHPQSL
jgi:hypothetical protein